MIDKTERFLDAKSVAEMLDVSAKTVRKWIAKGTLPSYQLPGSRVHRVAYLDVIGAIKGHKGSSKDIAKRKEDA